MKEYVLKQGYNFYQLNTYPFGLGYENELNKNSLDRKLDALIDRFKDRIYNQRKKELLKMVSELKPYLIIIDTFLSTDFVVLYNIAKENTIKIAFGNTSLSSYYNPSSLSAPLFSSAVTTLEIKKDWSKYFFSRFLDNFRNKVLLFGRDNKSMVMKKIKANKIPKLYMMDRKKTFHVGFKNITELIFSPIEIELLVEKHRPWQHYLGNYIETKRVELNIDMRFSKERHKHLNHKATGKKVLYCSFGTVHLSSKRIIEVVDYLFEIAKNMPNIIFIINGKTTKHKLPNVYVYEKVPQLDLLSIADVFLTHGGLNSIKEAIRFKTPLIIYPTETIWDQIGNASKVVNLGIGLKVESQNSTIDDFYNAINQVLTDISYKNNLTALNKAIEQRYTEKQLLNTIENIAYLS